MFGLQSFPAIVRARRRLLWKRYGNALTVVALIIAGLIARHLGSNSLRFAFEGEAGLSFQSRSWPLLLALGALAWSSVMALTSRASLYDSRDHTILLGHPISASAFVLEYLLERLLFQAVPVLLLALALDSAMRAVGRPLGLVALTLTALSLWLTVTGLGLLMAALLQKLGAWFQALLGLALLSLLGLAAAAWFWPEALGQPLRESLTGLSPERRALIPGLALAPALEGRGLALAVSLALGLGLVLGAWLLASHRLFEDQSRARTRARLYWLQSSAALTALLGPLPAPWRALLRRDLLLILRGAFVRAWVVLGAACLLPVAYATLSQDKELELWSFHLMTMLFMVVLAAALSFLCGADFPKARRAQLIFERAHPVDGVAVLNSRTLLGFVLALPYALAILVMVFTHQRYDVQEDGLSIAAECSLLLFALIRYGTIMGLRSELDDSGVEGMAFPITVGFFGLFLALIALIHPALLLLFPFFQSAAAETATKLYEHSELLER